MTKLYTRRKAGKVKNQHLLDGLEVTLRYTYTEPPFQIAILHHHERFISDNHFSISKRYCMQKFWNFQLEQGP